ncbi:conserved hypothetical protein [Streptococcus agalactiae CJB111]|nr:conserved hypothetical protein [Streptococcus agalactiae CJB111]
MKLVVDFTKDVAIKNPLQFHCNDDNDKTCRGINSLYLNVNKFYFKKRCRNSLVLSCVGFSKSCLGVPCSAMIPLSMKITRSDTSLANSISCVTIIIVNPDLARSCIVLRTSPTISGSKAEVGSSKSIASGLTESARAIATRCFCPPDNCFGLAFQYCSVMPTAFKFSLAIFSASWRSRFRTVVCATIAFSKIFKFSKRLKD